MNDVLPFAVGKRIDDVALLSRSSALSQLDVRDLGVFLDTLEQLTLPPGAVVFAQGDADAHVYFVLDGAVGVRRGPTELHRLGPADHFGERALLGDARRTTTAIAASPLRLARLSRARFEALSATHPRVALRVALALAASLSATVTALMADAGQHLETRTLPRRATVHVRVSGARLEVPTGVLARTLLPNDVHGALVVAASLDHKPVSLDTPMTADATLEPITVSHWEGRRILRTTVGLLLLEAARRVLPRAAIALGSRRGEAQHVVWPKVDAEDVAAVERRMRELVEAETPIREERWTVDEARARLVEQGWDDAAALVPFHRDRTIALATCGATVAFGLAPVMPSARGASGFSLSVDEEAVFLAFGDVLRPRESTRTSAVAAVRASLPAERTVSRVHPRIRDAMSHDLAAWLETMGVRSVGGFNRACVGGQVEELIRVSEGFHEKNVGKIADQITQERRARVVAIAGPSSSGKTTFIRRLKVQLEVDGVRPVHLSIDDYYLDRARTPKDEDGDHDFESIAAIDVALFQSHVTRLLAGERVRTSRYDFATGRSLPVGGAEVALSGRDVLLVEGLHALSPSLLAEFARCESTYRAFVHPATELPFDRLSSVLPEDVRLVRRIVRDRHQRSAPASESIRRWPSVRRGEERHVFPTVAEADVVFDASLVYELAVLRVYAERYLLEVGEDDPSFATAYRLRQLLDRFVPIHPDHVPRTSLLREFIGGSGFDG